MNLDKLMSSLAGSGVLGGLAGGVAGGALMNNKKARKTAGNVLKIGGLAALGGLAWKAYQGYQSQQVGSRTEGVSASLASPPSNPVWGNLNNRGFELESQTAEQGSRAVLLIQAMIAAACADGHMDDVERERIMRQVSMAELAREEKALVFDTLQTPPSLVELSQRVDCPELAAEVYMASLLAVDETRSEAGLYLNALAYRLGIPQDMVDQMHNQLPSSTLEVA